MKQVDPQGMPSAELQATKNGGTVVDLGKKGLFAPIDRFAQAGTDQEETQIREQGEIIG